MLISVLHFFFHSNIAPFCFTLLCHFTLHLSVPQYLMLFHTVSFCSTRLLSVLQHASFCTALFFPFRNASFCSTLLLAVLSLPHCLFPLHTAFFLFPPCFFMFHIAFSVPCCFFLHYSALSITRCFHCYYLFHTASFCSAPLSYVLYCFILLLFIQHKFSLFKTGFILFKMASFCSTTTSFWSH